jgi:hypothetical protein
MENDTLTKREKRLLKRYKSYRGVRLLFLLLAILFFVMLIVIWLTYTGAGERVEIMMEHFLDSIGMCLILAYAFNARVRHCETLLRMQAENDNSK